MITAYPPSSETLDISNRHAPLIIIPYRKRIVSLDASQAVRIISIAVFYITNVYNYQRKNSQIINKY